MPHEPPSLDLPARRFAALGDATRLGVFRLLTQAPRSVAELAEQVTVSRPAVSQHLKVLADAGLVRFDTEGTRNIYRPDADGVAAMRDFIDGLWDVALARFQAAVAQAALQSASAPIPPSPTTNRKRTRP